MGSGTAAALLETLVLMAFLHTIKTTEKNA